MINDPWLSMLQGLVQNYDELKDIVDNGYKVIPTLEKIQGGWSLRLEEQFNKSNDYIALEYDNLDTRVIWTVSQLEDWPDVKRTAWDMWKFKNKSDAEKFITLYYLKWDR